MELERFLVLERVADLCLPQFDPYESLASAFSDHGRVKAAKNAEVPASAGGLSRMSTFPPLFLPFY